MNRPSWRRRAVWIGVACVPAVSCSITTSSVTTGSGGLGAVSVGFSEAIVEFGLALIVLIGCGVFFWNRRR